MILEYMAKQADAIGLPYEFWEWTAEVRAVYFTGEYSEESSSPESGEGYGRFTLIGHSYDGVELLDGWHKKIMAHFAGGRREAQPGAGVAAMYDGAQYVPTGLEALKRIEIYFTVREWRK
jgi:hypothetical protein